MSAIGHARRAMTSRRPASKVPLGITEVPPRQLAAPDAADWASHAIYTVTSRLMTRYKYYFSYFRSRHLSRGLFSFDIASAKQRY